MKLWLIVIAAMFAASGCSKKRSSAEVFKGIGEMRVAHHDAISQRCTPAYELLKKKDQPAITEDKVTGVPALHGWPKGNAGVLTEEWAAKTEWHANKVNEKREVVGSLALRSTSTPPIPEFTDLCEWIVKNEDTPENNHIGQIPDEEVVKLVERSLAALDGVHYTVAVRFVDYVRPETSASGFKPGRVKGEARIFDDHGEQHGGFRFAAQSSKSVQYSAQVDKRTGETSDDVPESVQGDLSDNISKAFTATLAAVVPGSDLPLL